MNIHVVQPGETLWSIARENDLPLGLLLDLNELPDPDQLTPGQNIVLRYPREMYTVVPGDTLYQIAERSRVPLTELWQNNPQLAGKTEISPGQKLVLRYQRKKEGLLAVNGYAYPFIDWDILRRTLPFLTWLSVFSVGFADSGALLPFEDGGLPALAREYGVTPILVVTAMDENGMFSGERVSALLRDDAAKTRLVESIRTALVAGGYGGVDIDFEYIPPEDGPAYADFIGRLEHRLREDDLSVATALAPKISAEQKGLLYEAHDYAALGKVSDDLLLMTYEWGYAKSEPRAVAPIDQVTRVVDYATSVIPPQKLLLGVPSYGYEWVLPYVKGESTARSLGCVQAVQQAVEAGVPIRFDETAQSPHYRYTADGLQREVWFEDAQSVAAKLALAADRGLRGISVWNLMKWFPQLWQVLAGAYQIVKLPQ